MTHSLPLRWCLAVLLISALATAGCDSSFEPPDLETPDALSVMAFLAEGDTTARVLVTRVASPETPEFTDTVYVSTADVFLNDTRIPAVEPAFVPNDGAPFEDVFNYAAPIEAVTAGEAFALTVQEGDEQVQGEIRIPGPFSGEGSGRRLSWTPSEGAAAYRVFIEPIGWTGITRDTTLRIPSDVAVRRGIYRVQVDALDPNLTAFMLDEKLIAGVRGGYGVVGGVYRTEFEASLGGF